MIPEIKHRSKYFIQLLIALFLSIVVVISCNKDSLSPKDSSQMTNNENTIDQFQLGNQLITDKSFEKKTYKEYPASSKKRVSYIFEAHEQSRRIYFHHNWINVDNNGKNYKYIVEFQTLNKDDKWSLLNPKNITGKVRIYNFDNEFIDYLSFENGELIYSFNNSEFKFDAQFSGSRDVPPCNPALGGGGLGPGNTITTYVWAFTTTEHYTDWWDFNPLTNEYTFSNTQYNGSTLDVTQVACVDLSDDPSWNGEHYDIYKIEHIRKINEIDDDEKPDGSGKTLPVVIIDPCNPETPTMELAHDIVVAIAHKGDKGDSHSNDDVFLETLSGQEYHQLQLEIDELTNNTLVDPCNSSLSTEGVLNNILSTIEECTKNSFSESLSNAEIVILDPSFSDCYLANCMFDKLKNGGNGLFCETIGNFIGSADFDVTFQAVSQPFSSTTPPEDNGMITISISNTLCNGSSHPLDVAGSLLHEGIHAEMYRKALDVLGAPLDPNSYEEIWNVNLKLQFPGFEAPYSTAQHEIMALKYVDQIANSLMELDDKQFPLDYYKFIAWGGLELYGNYLGFVSEYITEYSSQNEILINTNKVYCD